MSDDILISDADGVRTLTFNRADKKNAITRAMYAAMAEAIREGDADTSIRVIVHKGSGDSFTAGNDMMDFMQHPPSLDTPEGSPVAQYMDALMTCAKPVVAVVDGLAIGIGTTLLLHCDLVYASDRATFTTPFVSLGLVPEFGSSEIMPRMMGHQQAAEMLLLGERVSAEDGLRLGFVTRVYPAADLDAKADAAIAKLAALAPSAVRETKAFMKMGREATPARMHAEGKRFGERLGSGEFKEAATAFMQRRKPDFSKFD